VFSNTILPLAQNKSSYTIQMAFVIKAVLMPSSFRVKAIIVTKVTDYPSQTK